MNLFVLSLPKTVEVYREDWYVLELIAGFSFLEWYTGSFAEFLDRGRHLDNPCAKIANRVFDHFAE